MPTTTMMKAAPSSSNLQRNESVTSSNSKRNSRSSNNFTTATANSNSNNNNKATATTKPKVFGNFRSSVSSITSKPLSKTTTTSSRSSGGNDDRSGTNSNSGWARHYNHKTASSSSKDDYLNHTDVTEDSSHNSPTQFPNNNDDEPIITESSYVYPTTTPSTTATRSTTPIDSSNYGKYIGSRSVNNNNNTDAASTKAVKPVTEMLWESAEPFIAYSSEQGVKWCSTMDRFSSVLKDTCMLGTPQQRNVNSGENAQQQLSQNHDYDDTFAIVGTQEDDDEEEDGVVNSNKNTMFSSFSNVDITNLCGSTHDDKAIVPKVISWTTTLQEIVPCGQLQQVYDMELQLLSTNSTQEALYSDSDTNHNTTSRNHNRRIVISRTHEDIEVSPGHHVKVRLPPTNPIVKSPSRFSMNNKAIKVMQLPVVEPQQQAAVMTTNVTQKPSLVDPSSTSQLQRQIVKTNSSDSCKAVPHQPNDIVADQNGDNNFPNANYKNSDDDNVGATTTEAAKVNSGVVPVVSFEVKPEEALELERSISELTMRSSYAATDSALQKIPENRRMAYYAVGKHHRQSGKGGNRRCYFSGKLILGGTPFYAGSVLQGLRTLVVFCLPSSVGLPDKESLLQLSLQQQRSPRQLLASRSDSHSTGTNTLRGLRLLKSRTNGSGSKQSSPSYISHYTQHSNNLGAGASHTGSTIKSTGILSHRSSSGNRSTQQNQRSNNNFNSGASTAGSKSMMSRLSSLDDLSLSVEGDLDPNWSLDRDLLLKMLPPANADLLRSMSTLYPEQFETLPVQVREAKQWKLFVKFCFFSGLPISDGEMHYKVRDDIAEQVYGEEIVLSHDVMEASTGASAEILTLPNRTVMRYLRKHYAQQCSKLDDRVFQRASWERVAPEV